MIVIALGLCLRQRRTGLNGTRLELLLLLLLMLTLNLSGYAASRCNILFEGLRGTRVRHPGRLAWIGPSAGLQSVPAVLFSVSINELGINKTELGEYATNKSPCL